MLLYHFSKKSRPIITFVLFLFGIIFGFASYYQFSFIPKTQETLQEAKEEVWLGKGTVYEDIKEKDFVTFALKEIEKRCPLYVPDGATYRQCLATWEEEVEKRSIPEAVDEVHNYCSTWVGKYADEGTILAGELFSKCVIFKLQ